MNYLQFFFTYFKASVGYDGPSPVHKILRRYQECKIICRNDKLCIRDCAHSYFDGFLTKRSKITDEEMNSCIGICDLFLLEDYEFKNDCIQACANDYEGFVKQVNDMFKD